MARGGKRPGTGRKKGTPNRASAERAERAAKSGMLPHEFLLAVSRGEKIDGHKPTFAERVDAASKAAPYYASKLASVTLHGNNDDGSFTFNVNLNGADARA